MEIQESVKNEDDFFVERGPVLQIATDALMQISKLGKICVRAEGDLIPNAVSVANIITENFLKNNSNISKIILDSDISTDDGKMISKIKIIIVKN